MYIGWKEIRMDKRKIYVKRMERAKNGERKDRRKEDGKRLEWKSKM